MLVLWRFDVVQRATVAHDFGLWPAWLCAFFQLGSASLLFALRSLPFGWNTYGDGVARRHSRAAQLALQIVQAGLVVCEREVALLQVQWLHDDPTCFALPLIGLRLTVQAGLLR